MLPRAHINHHSLSSSNVKRSTPHLFAHERSSSYVYGITTKLEREREIVREMICGLKQHETMCFYR